MESRRLELQSTLDAQRGPLERNRLGQFATPTELAREIVAYSVALLPGEEPIRFLDPAIGTGSFYSALRTATSPSRIADARGFEIDAHYGAPARALWRRTPLRVTLCDFTTSRPREPNELSNLLICNPPYVRHHHLSRVAKIRLQRAAESSWGARIAGLSGLYVYFMALAHAWMSKGGIAAWLIPSEFMDVNYGRAVKEYLLKRVTLLRVHRFDPTQVQFGDALVSSAVVWFRNEPSPPRHEVPFTFGGSLLSPRMNRLIASDSLAQEPKWTRFPVGTVRPRDTSPKLGDLFKIQRGVATGDNAYFIMTPAEAAERRLPRRFLRPILPSPRFLPESEVLADAEGSPLIRRPRLLLDCRLPEGEVRARYPNLWEYLQSGVPAVSKRYLCSHRTPWYRQEDRAAAPFVCTYMGRGDGRSGSPFRFILNHSRATAANVYLLLYPKEAMRDALARDPGLAHRVWGILQAIERESLLDEGRVYGGGLYKLEPAELMNVGAEALAALVDGVTGRSEAQPGLFEGRTAAIG